MKLIINYFKFENQFEIGKADLSELDVTRTMKSEMSLKPMIIRCEEGWLVPEQNYLNSNGPTFNSVDGLIIDTKHGTFEILVSTDEQIVPLCDGQDIDEIIMKGLSHSVFSLDQADFKLDYHPFQQMRFSPKSLKNSRYLSTLLAADYLLKMIATNTEVISKSSEY